MIAPFHLPHHSLRYAEVYSADNAKIGSLARVQDAGAGLLRIEVGGHLTPRAGCLTLPLSQLAFDRDQDGVVFLRAPHDKSVCLTLLMRQNAKPKVSRGLLPHLARWWA